MSSDPMAMSSPRPQSIPPSRVACWRLDSMVRSLGWTWKPAGKATWESPMRSTTSRVMALVQPIIIPAPAAWEAGISRALRWRPTRVGSDWSCPSAASSAIEVTSSFSAWAARVSVRMRSSSSWKLRSMVSTSSRVMSPRPTRSRV